MCLGVRLPRSRFARCLDLRVRSRSVRGLLLRRGVRRVVFRLLARGDRVVLRSRVVGADGGPSVLLRVLPTIRVSSRRMSLYSGLPNTLRVHVISVWHVPAVASHVSYFY